MALKYALAKLRREELGRAVFVTLTYPEEFPAPDDHAVYKNHLRVFNQALHRKFGASGFWKLEFQQRGAAHFHLLVFGLADQDLVELRQWVARKWFETVRSGDEKHLRAGTQVDVPRSIGGAISYLVKYLSKSDQTRPGNFTGRYWGRFNQAALPVCELERIDLTERETVILKRWARKIQKKHVEASRWKRALEAPGHVFASGDGWSRLAVERAMSGGRVQVMTVLRKGHQFETVDSERGWIPAGTVCWSTCSGRNLFRFPKRYRPKQNDTVRLIADADHFITCLFK